MRCRTWLGFEQYINYFTLENGVIFDNKFILLLICFFIGYYRIMGVRGNFKFKNV